MSTFSKTARDNIKNQNKASNADNATLNRAGGISFEVKDPSLKLISMTGGSFFAEPKYYSGNKVANSNELMQRLVMNNSNAISFAKCDDLDDVAKEIIATVVDVCNSDHPKDALSIANWLRNEMNIRLTPQIILVLASYHPNTQKYVREYCSKVIVRPDEIKTCLLAHRYFFGNKNLKNCLNMGLADALSKFSEKALLKYDDNNFPTWKDVVRWIKRKNNWPLSKEMARYFTHGEVSESGTPLAYKRKQMAKLSDFNETAKRLAKESLVNWEVLVSQFGNKPEVWSHLINNNQMGYMALIRNLRNILEADVEWGTLKKVSETISDRKQVINSRQLPFRYLSAYRTLKRDDGLKYYSMSFSNERNRPIDMQKVDLSKMNEILTAIEDATDISVENVNHIPGTTAIFADNSGSMSRPVSKNSQISCAEAANMLCGIAAKRSEQVYLFAFATDVAPIRFSKRDSVVSIANNVARADTRGCATNGHRCIEYLTQNNIKVDRVIIISDMQCWNNSFGTYSFSSYGSSYGNRSNFADNWQKYKKSNRDCWLHSVHLNGYGDNVVDEDKDKVNLVSGFSEKLFNMALETEGVVESDSEENLPTVEQIRKKW